MQPVVRRAEILLNVLNERISRASESESKPEWNQLRAPRSPTGSRCKYHQKIDSPPVEAQEP